MRPSAPLDPLQVVDHSDPYAVVEFLLTLRGAPPRMRRVALLRALNYRVDEIAGRIGTSTRTVERELADPRLYEALGLLASPRGGAPVGAGTSPEERLLKAVADFRAGLPTLLEDDGMGG